MADEHWLPKCVRLDDEIVKSHMTELFKPESVAGRYLSDMVKLSDGDWMLVFEPSPLSMYRLLEQEREDGKVSPTQESGGNREGEGDA